MDVMRHEKLAEPGKTGNISNVIALENGHLAETGKDQEKNSY
jgi:hypothetical protein